MALEQLEGVDVFKQTNVFAQELGHLTYLRRISFFLRHKDPKEFDTVGSEDLRFHMITKTEPKRNIWPSCLLNKHSNQVHKT